LAKRLPVAPTARQALTQIEAAAGPLLAERAPPGGPGRPPGGGRALRQAARGGVRRGRRLGVARYSTPELLALERQLVDGATQRADERCAVVGSELVRPVLDRPRTAGKDPGAVGRAR